MIVLGVAGELENKRMPHDETDMVMEVSSFSSSPIDYSMSLEALIFVFDDRSSIRFDWRTVTGFRRMISEIIRGGISVLCQAKGGGDGLQ